MSEESMAAILDKEARKHGLFVRIANRQFEVCRKDTGAMVYESVTMEDIAAYFGRLTIAARFAEDSGK